MYVQAGNEEIVIFVTLAEMVVVEDTWAMIKLRVYKNGYKLVDLN